MILKGYLRREVVKTAMGILLILILIFTLQRFVYYINSAASGQLSTSLVGELLLLQIPRIFSLLLPLSLFLGTMIALGRMYADQEITVMRACGIGQHSLTTALLKPAVLFMLLSMAMGFWITPWAGNLQYEIMDKQAAQKDITLLSPGRFQKGSDGNSIVYIQKQDGKGQFTNIFMAKNDNQNLASSSINTEITVISSQKGQIIRKKDDERFFILNKGKSYQGIPGQRNFDISSFNEYLLRIPNETSQRRKRDYDVLSTSRLVEIADAKAQAEIQWRISMGLSSLILILVAIPLSRVKPRQGKYAKLGVGLIIYILYLTLMILSKNWVENGLIPNQLGLWWIHLLMFILSLYLSGYFYGKFTFLSSSGKGG